MVRFLVQARILPLTAVVMNTVGSAEAIYIGSFKIV